MGNLLRPLCNQRGTLDPASAHRRTGCGTTLSCSKSGAQSLPLLRLFIFEPSSTNATYVLRIHHLASRQSARRECPDQGAIHHLTDERWSAHRKTDATSHQELCTQFMASKEELPTERFARFAMTNERLSADLATCLVPDEQHHVF